MEKEKSCGTMCFDGNKVLMVKHNVGHWAFPKGHVDKGETEIETALREIKEETHLDVEIDSSFRHVVNYSPKIGVTKDVVYFCATPKSDEIIAQKEEISKIQWISLDEAYKIVTFDNDRNLIKQFKEYICK